MAGNLSVETCGEVFAPTSRKASSNYGIGSDGRVGMYVEEKNRAWTSSSASNDHQAITIEVANDQIGDQWHVSDKALAKLIDLCVDICKRNNIKQLNFTGDKNGNLTMHKYFAATNCPGPYLESKFPYIANEVNKRLGVKVETTTATTSASTYTVVKGDTLSKIGTKTGVAWKTIAELNGIKFPYIINIGQVLKLTENNTGSNTTSSSTTAIPLKITQDKKNIQEFLNKYYGTEIKKVIGATLSIDGSIGTKSKKALAIAFQVELNKLGAQLDVDGSFGGKTEKAFTQYVGTLKKGVKGSIFVTLWQCVLVGNNLDPKGIDGSFGSGCVSATNDLFEKIGLNKDSSVSGADINKIL